MFKALIIDDEPLARARLRRLLSNYAADLMIIGEAANGEEGAELINVLKPDVIFLDIEMPVLNGFEMLAKLEFHPTVIFATAYDQYAVKAFEKNSIDYLLKPIEEERLAKTMQRLRHDLIKNNFNAAKQAVVNAPAKKMSTLSLQIGERIILVKTEDIVYIEADEKYVFIHTKDDKKYITDFTLKGLEEKLNNDFMRIHRSLIININQIDEIRRSFNGAFTFVMKGTAQARLKSSRSYADEIRKTLEI